MNFQSRGLISDTETIEAMAPLILERKGRTCKRLAILLSHTHTLPKIHFNFSTDKSVAFYSSNPAEIIMRKKTYDPPRDLCIHSVCT